MIDGRSSLTSTGYARPSRRNLTRESARVMQINQIAVPSETSGLPGRWLAQAKK